MSIAVREHPWTLTLRRSISMTIYAQKYGFVYIWYDKKNKRYYIGSHWGTEDDGYICSSNWMYKTYKRRSHDFKRRIIARVYTNRTDLLTEEQRWLSFIKDEELATKNTTLAKRRNVRYYNFSKSTKNPWHSTEDGVKTIGEKISKAKTGKSNPCTPEKAVAISEAKKKKFDEKQKKLGYKFSPEHASKLSEGRKGKKHTDEWKVENAIRMKEQWSNGTRKRAEPKQKMTKEEQAKLSSDTLKSKWSDPEWAANQKLALAEGAKKRPPRSEESKQRTRDTFAKKREMKLQTV
jgi:hypothetical protein